MTATQDTRHFLPYCPNRPTIVPAVSLEFPMIGTGGTVGTVDIEEELLYIESYPVRESSLLGVTSVPSVPRRHTCFAHIPSNLFSKETNLFRGLPP